MNILRCWLILMAYLLFVLHTLFCYCSLFRCFICNWCLLFLPYFNFGGKWGGNENKTPPFFSVIFFFMMPMIIMIIIFLLFCFWLSASKVNLFFQVNIEDRGQLLETESKSDWLSTYWSNSSCQIMIFVLLICICLNWILGLDRASLEKKED